MSKYNNIPVFIINMPNRPDRKEHMKDLMNKLGFRDYTFVFPYAANETTKKLFEKEIGKPFNMSFGKASHNMTYLSLLKLQNVDNMFIMEDDLLITKPLENVKKELDIIVNNHPKDANMIYMEMCYEKCGMNKINNFVKLENPLCTAAIYYPSKRDRKLIVNNLLTNFDFSNKAIDEAFRSLINSGLINAYMHNLLFIQDNNFGSDLEGSLGYGEKYKPMTPICSNIKETIDYLKKEEYKDEIKQMYNNEYSNNKEVLNVSKKNKIHVDNPYEYYKNSVEIFTKGDDKKNYIYIK